VTEFGRRVNELEVDLLQGGTLGVDEEALSESQNPLLRTNAATLDHEEVVVDLTIMRETTHWSDALLGQIVFGRGVVDDLLSILDVDTLADTVDLLVHLGTMVITLLTSASDGELNSRRMPSTDTSDLAQTLVRLTGKLLGVPTGSDTLSSVTLGDTDDVDHLILSKDAANWDLLLHVGLGPFQLLGDATTVELDFHDVSLLLTLLQQLHLSVSDDTDDGAVLLHDLEIMFDLLLAKGILPFLASLGESLPLGLMPILVEATSAVFA